MRRATVLLCPYADADGVRKLALSRMTADRAEGLIHGVDIRTRGAAFDAARRLRHMHLTSDRANGRRRNFDCRRPRTRNAQDGDKLPGA
jgi:hypothetical protein